MHRSSMESQVLLAIVLERTAHVRQQQPAGELKNVRGATLLTRVGSR